MLVTCCTQTVNAASQFHECAAAMAEAMLDMDQVYMHVNSGVITGSTPALIAVQCCKVCEARCVLIVRQTH